mmetsp:Transcript_2415/g.6494  ORF Transcript_2415/g.6494 Transcript_2415/m.6494 type:complete len:302 (+) Transcript_2415:100-1005(+)
MVAPGWRASAKRRGSVLTFAITLFKTKLGSREDKRSRISFWAGSVTWSRREAPRSAASPLPPQDPHPLLSRDDLTSTLTSKGLTPKGAKKLAAAIKKASSSSAAPSQSRRQAVKLRRSRSPSAAGLEVGFAVVLTVTGLGMGSSMEVSTGFGVSSSVGVMVGVMVGVTVRFAVRFAVRLAVGCVVGVRVSFRLGTEIGLATRMSSSFLQRGHASHFSKTVRYSVLYLTTSMVWNTICGSMIGRTRLSTTWITPFEARPSAAMIWGQLLGSDPSSMFLAPTWYLVPRGRALAAPISWRLRCR